MKKFNLLKATLVVASFMLFSAYSIGQEYQISEGFLTSDLPEGWEAPQVTVGEELKDAIYITNKSDNGIITGGDTRSIRFQYDSAIVTAPSVSSAGTLEFYLMIGASNFSDETFTVELSKDGGAFEPIATYATSKAEIATEWGASAKKTIEINESGACQIRFVISYPSANSSNDDRIFLDDITLTTAGATDLSESIDNAFLLKSNVVNTTLDFSADTKFSRISIVDLNGRNVLSLKNNAQHSIDVSRLNPGMYFLLVEGNSGQSVKRFFKK